MNLSIHEGKFQKLFILSYTDKELSKDKLSFTAYYNPALVTTTYAIGYDEKAAVGASKYEMKYKSYSPVAYSFDLILDGTGASIPYGTIETESLDVDKKINVFLQVVNKYDGGAHRPRYLKLTWGETLVANVVLTGLTITKELFRPDGSTLRAKLQCTFKEFSEREKTKAEERSASPNMTHIRLVQQGDRLPMMCEEIYGDAKLYLQVAKHNKLLNYRNLIPGQKIYFPPLVPLNS